MIQPQKRPQDSLLRDNYCPPYLSQLSQVVLPATGSISTNTPSMQINIYMTEVTIEAMRI